MTQHITRIVKSFFMAFVLVFSANNAKADDIPTLSKCSVSNDTLYIDACGYEGYKRWNDFVNAYNTYIDDVTTHNNFIDKSNTNYSFDDINVFCLKGERLYIYGSEKLIQLKRIPSGKTLTFDESTYIAGSLTIGGLGYNNNPITEYTGLVGINEGTICNVSISGALLATKQENANSLGFGVICSENKGIIENCEVQEVSIYVYDVIDNSTIMIGALAGINSGTIRNCLVSDFELNDKVSNKTRTLLFGQIAGAVSNPTPNISNCCIFISEKKYITNNNYPFVSSVWATDKYELVTDANVTWNNLSSNRVFVLCGVSSTDRLPASVASYYSEQPSGNNYSTCLIDCVSVG